MIVVDGVKVVWVLWLVIVVFWCLMYVLGVGVVYLCV